MPQALAQGRSMRLIALYGHWFWQRPHFTHFVWSMTLLPSRPTYIAPFGQTFMHGCDRQPWQLEEMRISFGGQALQAKGITFISGGS